jgi:hypothetical protein
MMRREVLADEFGATVAPLIVPRGLRHLFGAPRWPGRSWEQRSSLDTGRVTIYRERTRAVTIRNVDGSTNEIRTIQKEIT